MSIRQAFDSKFEYGYPAPGEQNPTPENVLTHGASAFFLTPPEWEQARTATAYDYIVVGTSFCALAFCDKIFSKDPNASVLLIERGPFFLPDHFQNLPLPFQYVLGGHAETFPWKMSTRTQLENDYIKFNRGQIPFFGGRSTLWSSFCPTPSDAELDGWPKELKDAARKYFETARTLLHVQDLDTYNNKIYSTLQHLGLKLLQTNPDATTYRVEGAPLACRGTAGLDFEKYSVIRDLLNLFLAVKSNTEAKGRLDIVNECVVSNIINEGGHATALETSRGTIALGNAQLILAMGALPPATLLRNSFIKTAPSIAQNIGRRFAAHFITSIIARVPVALIAPPPPATIGPLEMGGYYVAGVANNDYKRQFHIDLSLFHNDDPKNTQALALRYMPDVVANPSLSQMMSSVGYIVIVCASLGELDSSNPENGFLHDIGSGDVTSNSVLQVLENQNDMITWKAMDNMTFHTIEQSLGKNQNQVEYWIETDQKKGWYKERPSKAQRRTSGLVHESSVLHVGKEDTAPVGLDYKVKGTKNIYVTGAGLWPRGGSWNPTMTMVALAQDLGEKLSQNKRRD